MILKNAKILYKNEFITTDLQIENGKIAKIGKTENQFDKDIHDLNGDYLLPGFIDIHTHLDDKIGRFYLADNYESGTKIAVKNGITTVFNFITQNANLTLTEALEIGKKKAENHSNCNVKWHLTPTTFTENDWNSIYNLIDKGYKTFKFYTTYKKAGIYSSYGNLEEIFQKLEGRNTTILVHCEDDEVLEKATVNTSEEEKIPFTHAVSRPKEAEIEAVKKVIELCRKYKQKVHIVHVSTPEAAEIIFEAKKTLPLTCETCPQYLFLNDSLLKTENGHRYICSPPLRNSADMLKMKEFAKKGYFDVFATDHCAFTKKDKDDWNESFRNIANGLPGLGALPAMSFNLFDEINEENVKLISKCLSENPAKVTGLYPNKGTIEIGADADLVVIDLKGKNKVISSLSDTYDVYENFTTKLNIKRVYLNGESHSL